MNNPKNIFYAKGHVEPYRIFLQNKGETFGLIDLQIKAELKNLDNPVTQQHSLSIYLKPPINTKYKLHSKDYILSQSTPGLVSCELITENNSDYFNPYVSWHGSGEIHATAFKNGDSGKPERIVEDRVALAWNEVAMYPSLVLRAVIPVADLSHALLIPDDKHSIHLMANHNDQTIDNDLNGIILDQTKLVTNSIHVDVFIHNKAYKLSDPNELPYPNNSEIIWLAPPLVFSNSESIFAPAVSIFIYQPVNDSEGESERLPLVLTGISKIHPVDDIIIQAKIDI